MTDSRRLFEEWLDRAYPDSYSTERNTLAKAEYASCRVQLAWEAWQAGRVYEKERVLN